MAAVLCAALYPNIVQVLTPELKYKQTSTGAMCKAPTSEELKVRERDILRLKIPSVPFLDYISNPWNP